MGSDADVQTRDVLARWESTLDRLAADSRATSHTSPTFESESPETHLAPVVKVHVTGVPSRRPASDLIELSSSTV